MNGIARWGPAAAVAAGAAVATAHGLVEVAAASKVPDPIAISYPLITDGLALVAYSATRRLTGAAAGYAWAVVVVAAGLSGLAQAVFLAADTVVAEPALRFGVGAWPAIAAGLAAHLLHLLVTADDTDTAADGGHAGPGGLRIGAPDARGHGDVPDDVQVRDGQVVEHTAAGAAGRASEQDRDGKQDRDGHATSSTRTAAPALQPASTDEPALSSPATSPRDNELEVGQRDVGEREVGPREVDPRVAALARRLARGEDLTGPAVAAEHGLADRSGRRLLGDARTHLEQHPRLHLVTDPTNRQENHA